MPKCNLLFIDESISVLDKERLDHIDDIFIFLKQYYSNVFLITHIEEVKQKMDSQITIYQINGRTIIRNIDTLYFLNLSDIPNNDLNISNTSNTSEIVKSTINNDKLKVDEIQ
jgi:ABC-type dipeptide/oligopeptide/nickel transport system ATPase subunit